MPWQQAFSKFGKGKLHSGSKNGPVVSDPKQAVAIAMSEKQKGEGSPALKGLKKAVKG